MMLATSEKRRGRRCSEDFLRRANGAVVLALGSFECLLQCLHRGSGVHSLRFPTPLASSTTAD